MTSKNPAAVARRKSVRYRLLVIALLPMLAILPIFLGVAAYRWNASFDDLLLAKAHNDLTIASQYMQEQLVEKQRALEALAGSVRFRDALPSQDMALPALLEREAVEHQLDLLCLVDSRGRIIASNLPLPAEVGPALLAARETDLPKLSTASFEVLTDANLDAVSPGLAERAALTLVPTRKAIPTNRTVETNGLVARYTVASDFDGSKLRLVGISLLNRDLELVDSIDSLVYSEAGLPHGSRGTVTLFLGDVRVSTNVPLEKGERALGTRVSEEVRQAVLIEGRDWLESAFVVDDWYVSAYEPIFDGAGRRIGMLYVGFLEAPFTRTKWVALLTIAVAFLLVAGATVPMFLRWARNIFQPLENIVNTISRVENGHPSARTGQMDTGDEIGRVASHLDELLDRVQERESELRHWNETLDRRVQERTHDLVLANREIEQRTKQLVMSEKLAAIGEISAGIAHEINNPLAVIQGNLEAIRAEAAGDPALEGDLRMLDEQVVRIHAIVTRLLQFSRPAEFCSTGEPLDPAALVTATLPLVEQLLHANAIEVERNDSATRQIAMNRTELQQVLVNLLVNAVRAMPEGGRITIRTADRNDESGIGGVAIEIEDNGEGMSPEVLEQVFDPFFTTDRDDGNGLGLSISRMLVQRAGGSLTASSEEDEGSVFCLWMPGAS